MSVSPPIFSIVLEVLANAIRKGDKNLCSVKDDIKRMRRKATDLGKMFANMIKTVIQNVQRWGFPGGAVVESLPANAGDTGSSPGLGRSRMPRSN